MVHATHSSLKEMGDKLSEDDRKPIESAVEVVEEAIKSDDKDAIEAAVAKLTEAAQVIYQQAAEQAQAEGGAEAEASSGDDNVVDAEFEEVNEDVDEEKKDD
jgi:molecular chaperone DnaK